MDEGLLSQNGDSSRHFMAWIATGLRHEAIRLSGRRQRRNQREILILDAPLSGIDTAEDTGRLIDLIPGPDDTEREAEDRVTLAGIVAALTPAQRKVIRGLAVQGLTERMVARLLGVSQATVNRTKRSALKRIKSYLV